jgi:hypothetical protein
MAGSLSLRLMRGFRLEPAGSLGAGRELAQSGKVRRLAFPQLRQDLVDDAVQLVRGLGAGDPRLAGETLGDFGFPHPVSC